MPVLELDGISKVGRGRFVAFDQAYLRQCVVVIQFAPWTTKPQRCRHRNVYAFMDFLLLAKIFENGSSLAVRCPAIDHKKEMQSRLASAARL